MFPPPVITGQSRLSRKMAEKVSENKIPNCTDTTGISSFYEGATLTALGSTFALNNSPQKWINTLGYTGNHMILLGLEVHCYKRCFAIMKKNKKKKQERQKKTLLLASLRNMNLCIQEATIKLIQKFMEKCVSFMFCVPVAKLYVQAIAWAMSKALHSSQFIKIEGALQEEIEYWKFIDD